MNIADMVQQVSGGKVDAQKLEQAAASHLAGLDNSQLRQHVEQAADNAGQNGETSIAQQLTGVVARFRTDPQGAKDEVVSLIKSNPQLLTHFAPEFAQGILGRLGV